MTSAAADGQDRVLSVGLPLPLNVSTLASLPFASGLALLNMRVICGLLSMKTKGACAFV